jgi:DNA-directed RNA polymerase subunit beta'
MLFPDVSEVIRAYDNKEVELTTRITVRITNTRKTPKRANSCDRDALRNHGRPRHPVGNPAEGLPFSVLNRALKKKEISKLINTSASAACALPWCSPTS